MDQQRDINGLPVVLEKKLFWTRQLLKVIFAALALLLFYSASDLYQKLVEIRLAQNAPVVGTEKILGIEAHKIVRPVPRRLQIPSINVDAFVEQVGFNSDGEMDVPAKTNDVGWYEPGPAPGERGSSVMTGHFNGENGRSGVFSNLDKLEKGDQIVTTDDAGRDITFIVRESRTYNPGYAEEVFSASDNGIHLNLITCDGAWDEVKESYSKRLVIFADIIN